MCGIAGFIQSETINAPKQVLKAMLWRIAHRGPDESGIYLSNCACLGSVRLSVVDVKMGKQPMSTPDGRFWISYNGEIYNHPELRVLLQKKGYYFKTESDTEVVLYMYQEFGPDCLHQLNGQFAIAIWDAHQKELFLARDRFAVRPLFYTQTEASFVFASEIKSLFEYPDVQRIINPMGLAQTFTFWSVQAPHSAFQNIFELPAGNFALIRKGKIKISPYYHLNFSNIHKISLTDAIDKFEDLFRKSISLRMRADVPIGAYLSGGLDSSSITAFIKEIYPKSLQTFSIGFEERDFDESNYQAEVADYLGTQHHSISFKNKDVINLFEKVIWHTETPILRTAPFPMFKLSELVQSHKIKVVLTGEGADEILGGYNIFKEVLIRHFWSKFPDSAIRPLLLKRLYPYLPQIKNGNIGLLKLFFGYKLTETESPIYSHLLRWNNTSKTQNFFSNFLKDQIEKFDFVADFQKEIAPKLENHTLLAKAQQIEINTFMQSYLLSSQGDRVSMANSVEGRYPFLDHTLVEFCTTLPDHLKISGLEEKYLLKQVIKNRIPTSVLQRSKQPYRAPIAQALVNDKTGFVDDYLSSDNIKDVGCFDPDRVKRLMDKMKKGDANNEVDNMALMGILSTQVLHNLYIKNFQPLREDEVKSSNVVNRTNL